MSAATLREGIIVEMQSVQTVGRTYQAPEAWLVPVGAVYTPGKAFAECLGNAIVDEFGAGNRFWIEPVLGFYNPTGGLPVSPATGDRHIASATANGWTINRVYQWSGAAWIETAPSEGFAVYDKNGDSIYTFNGTTWINLSSSSHARSHALDSTSDHTGVTGTENNFMALNASGLPKDSGSKASDFSAAGH
ncbi:MAG: DUF2793 domain-containing protein, partial [Chitinispirillaceae bacterium]|nr:DUF2793 domain-containing protein [Chitinispirillaceae bacterium]